MGNFQVSSVHYLLLVLLLTSGCSLAPSPLVTPTEDYAEAPRIQLNVPYFHDPNAAGAPASLASMLAYWHQDIAPSHIKKGIYIDRLEGTLPIDMLLTAENQGLRAIAVRGDKEILETELRAGHPAIVMLNQGWPSAPNDRFVVITGFDDGRRGFYVHAANQPNQFMPYRTFVRQWRQANFWTMVVEGPASS